MRKMQRQKRKPKITTAIVSVLAITTVFVSSPAKVSAAGGTILPVEVVGREVVSVGIPVVTEGEKSPFDFILDPQGLIYETDAMRYGGGTVEEGATLLFHNSNGGYNFSRYSDQLTVTNQSTVPVTVTISASVSNLEGVALSGSDDFTGNEAQSIYLALVDGEGNVQPISETGETSFSWVMQAAPENAYVYTINEEEQTYDCVLSGSPEEIGFDTYSFGLIGACNPNADWKDIAIHPVVTVVWHVDPILPEQEETIDGEAENGSDKEAEKEKETEEELDKELEILQKEMDAQRTGSEEEPADEEGLLTDTPGTDSADHTNGAEGDSIPDKNLGNTSDETTKDPEEDSADNGADHKANNNTAGTSGEMTDHTANNSAAGTSEESAGNTADKNRAGISGEPAGNTADKSTAGISGESAENMTN